MTRYLTWPDQASALSNADIIDANYIQFLVQKGYGVTDASRGLIDLRLSDNAPMFNAMRTLCWYVPKQTLLKDWVILHPENWERQNLQFVTACLNKTSGYTIKTDPADGTWWPANRLPG